MWLPVWFGVSTAMACLPIHCNFNRDVAPVEGRFNGVSERASERWHLARDHPVPGAASAGALTVRERRVDHHVAHCVARVRELSHALDAAEAAQDAVCAAPQVDEHVWLRQVDCQLRAARGGSSEREHGGDVEGGRLVERVRDLRALSEAWSEEWVWDEASQ